MRHSISPTDDPYLGTIDKIFFDWSKIQKNKLIQKVIDNVINPLKSLCEERIDYPRSKLFLPFVLECFSINDNIVTIKMLYSQNLQEKVEELQKNKEIIENSISYIKSLKKNIST